MYSKFTACKYAIGIPLLNNLWCSNIDTDTGVTNSLTISTDSSEIFAGGYLISTANTNDRIMFFCRLRGSDGIIQWSSGLL